MKVCHISDWHAKMRRLPPADLYVVTGDMLPNFPLLRIEIDKWRRDGIVTYDPYDPRSGPVPQGLFAGRIIDKKLEEHRQMEWCLQRPFRRETGLSEDACVLVVKGNHDFIPLADWIGGDVWEVDDDPTRTTTVLGLKIGGMRGINYIRGEWADELRRPDFDDRARKLPEDLDVLITHSPSLNILDRVLDQDSGNIIHWGSPTLASWINKRCLTHGPLRAHLFGHVHEACGVQSWGGGSITFSNAATTVNLLDL